MPIEYNAPFKNQQLLNTSEEIGCSSMFHGHSKSGIVAFYYRAGPWAPIKAANRNGSYSQETINSVESLGGDFSINNAFNPINLGAK